MLDTECLNVFIQKRGVNVFPTFYSETCTRTCFGWNEKEGKLRKVIGNVYIDNVSDDERCPKRMRNSKQVSLKS